MAKMASEAPIANTDMSEFYMGRKAEKEEIIRSIQKAMENPALKDLSSRTALGLLLIAIKTKDD